MAATLPINVTAKGTGHPGLHNAVNAAVNEHDARITSIESRTTALEAGGGTGTGGGQGPQGVGVASISDDDGDGVATVTLHDPKTGTDSTSSLPLPRGLKGDDGTTPPNPAFTASATTLAAGSAATASIGGTYPNLALALGIPRGADGTGGGGSSLQIVGAGRPDVTASMDATTQAAVASATVGTTFISTDGPQGAWVWRRRTTAWVCVDGDTGVRALLRPGSEIDALMLRRIGATVSCTMGTLNGENYNAWSWSSSISGNVTVAYGQQGFMTDAAIPGAVYDDGNHAIPIVMIALARGDTAQIQLRTSSTVDADELALMRSEPLIWNTSDSWPSTLPGTAV